MKEFLTYIENSTDEFASETKSPLIKELHMRVTEVKQSEEMEAEYITLLQRDRENIELGLEQGEEKMALLTKQLIKEKRFQDLEKATEDVAFRKQLFEEFKI